MNERKGSLLAFVPSSLDLIECRKRRGCVNRFGILSCSSDNKRFAMSLGHFLVLFWHVAGKKLCGTEQETGYFERRMRSFFIIG